MIDFYFPRTSIQINELSVNKKNFDGKTEPVNTEERQ